MEPLKSSVAAVNVLIGLGNVCPSLNKLHLIHLRILYTSLCTEEYVSTSVAAELLSDSSDMIECAKQVVSDLHVVLYINGSKVVSCFISRFYFCSGMLKIPDDQSHNQALLLRLLICLSHPVLLSHYDVRSALQHLQ